MVGRSLIIRGLLGGLGMLLIAPILSALPFLAGWAIFLTGRCDHVRFAAFGTVIGRPDGAGFSQTLLRPPGLFVSGVCESLAGWTIAAVYGSNKIPATKLTSIYSLAGAYGLALYGSVWLICNFGVNLSGKTAWAIFGMTCA